MTVDVLYPSDPLAPRRVDAHFSDEAGAVRDCGAATPLLDLDALLAGDAIEAVRRVPSGTGPLWYRGWMIPSDRYADLAHALERRGVCLVVPPERYRSAHELPGWYATFAAVTPRSVWRDLEAGTVPSPAELAELVAPLGAGPGMVKDYVKSRKDRWATACHVPDLTDTGALHRVVERFVELQDDLLAGGIVVRAFESFATATGGARAPEARVWWLDGAPVLVGAHPDTPDAVPAPDLEGIGPLVASLNCRFVTTDMAVRDDGVWRVVEVGDGQVSDRPSSVAPAGLAALLVATPATGS